MREILFRGKRADNGEWIYGDLLHDRFLLSDEKICQIYDMNSNLTHRQNIVIPETIGQYTGLTDKNGKKIFEGDILNGLLSLHPDRTIFRVGCECNGFYFFDEDRVGWHPDHIVDYEVIGNIHDNPELLGGD